MLDIVQALPFYLNGQGIGLDLLWIKLGRCTHIDKLMISWRVVANLVDKVILRVAEKLVKFVQDDGIDIHHLDFLELDQLKNTAWSSNENFGSLFEAFDLPFLTRAREEKLGTES